MYIPKTVVELISEICNRDTITNRLDNSDSSLYIFCMVNSFEFNLVDPLVIRSLVKNNLKFSSMLYHLEGYLQGSVTATSLENIIYNENLALLFPLFIEEIVELQDELFASEIDEDKVIDELSDVVNYTIMLSFISKLLVKTIQVSNKFNGDLVEKFKVPFFNITNNTETKNYGFTQPENKDDINLSLMAMVNGVVTAQRLFPSRKYYSFKVISDEAFTDIMKSFEIQMNSVMNTLEMLIKSVAIQLDDSSSNLNDKITNVIKKLNKHIPTKIKY